MSRRRQSEGDIMRQVLFVLALACLLFYALYKSCGPEDFEDERYPRLENYTDGFSRMSYTVTVYTSYEAFLARPIKTDKE